MAAPKGNNFSALRKSHPTYTDKEIDKICEDLLEWAHSGDGIWLCSYTYEKYKKSEGWLNNLAEHHPKLKDVIKEAKELIGGKVAKHCWIGDRNSSFGEKILPMYSEGYKKETERKADLQKPTEQKGCSVTDLLRFARDSGVDLKALLGQKSQNDE